MAKQNAIATVDAKYAEMTQERVDLIKTTICKGATNDELSLFIQVCNRTGLDPFARQIYAVKRWDSGAKREVMSTQISIDGARLVAERSGKYAGQLGPYWCGADGKWVDVWLSNNHPTAARVAVLRKDFNEPLWAVARFAAYAQTTKDKSPTAMWQKFPDLMIGKCAEALALRRAFPMELSGLYTTEEMSQADTPKPEATTQQAAQQLPPPVARESMKPLEAEVVAPEAKKPPVAPVPRQNNKAPSHMQRVSNFLVGTDGLGLNKEQCKKFVKDTLDRDVESMKDLSDMELDIVEIAASDLLLQRKGVA